MKRASASTGWRKQARLISRRPVVLPIVLFAIGLLVMFHLQSRTESGSFMITMLQTSLPLMCVSLGQTAVIISGGLDLSVAGVMSITSALAASHMTGNGDMAVWLPIMFGTGALAGLVNGLLVTFGGLPSFIVTLGTWSILDGLALEILPTQGGSIAPGLENLLGSNAATIIISIGLLAVWAVVRSTRFGVTIFSLGSGEGAARQAGLHVNTAKVSVYVFSALTAVGAGLFYSAVVTLSGSPTAGDPFLLQSFAAVVVGGTALSGGKGGFLGTVFGALLLSVISQIVVFAGFQSYYSELAYGAILVIMVSVYSLPTLIAKSRRNTG